MDEVQDLGGGRNEGWTLGHGREVVMSDCAEEFPGVDHPGHRQGTIMYGARNTDPITSHIAQGNSKGRLSQRDQLLLSYYIVGTALTDEEAFQEAGVNPRSCWWKRCSELREMGFIAYEADDNGQPVMVMGSMGKPVHLCKVTIEGRRYVSERKLLERTYPPL